MSVMFGVARPTKIDDGEMQRFAKQTARYGPDGEQNICIDGVGVGFQCLNTHDTGDIANYVSKDRLGNIVVIDTFQCTSQLSGTACSAFHCSRAS